MDNIQLQASKKHSKDLHEATPTPQNTPQKVRTLVPEIAQNYDFIEEIGKGTQGRVFKACRKSDSQYVAIKELNIASVSNWKAYELFHREVSVLSSLNVQGVAKFYEAKEFLDAPKPAAYLVQEYIEGRTLEQMLASGYRFSITRIFEMMVQLLTILKALHYHNPEVIHRDIKPSNIIMRPRGGDTFDVFLIDFGAVANPQVQHGGSTVAGTVGYMPPEQLMGNPVAASDIYALSALCVQLLSGVSPADMKMADFHLIFEPHIENLPNAIKAVLRNMLEPDLKLRHYDHDGLIRTFTQFAQGHFGEPRKLSFFASLFQASDFSKQLQRVEAFCEPGSFDLWQTLSEECPRFIPACWLKYFDGYTIASSNRKCSSFNIQSGSSVEEFRQKKHDERLAAETRRKKRIIINSIIEHSLNFVFIIGAILFSISLVCIFSLPVFILHNLPFSPIIVIISFFLAVIGILIMLFSSRNKNHINLKETVQLNNQFSSKSYIDPQILENNSIPNSIINKFPLYENSIFCLKELLADGKKAIATILSCEYVSAYHNAITPSSLHHFFDIASHSEISSMRVITAPPTFKIRYKFNPPDDANPEDLIHEITVHFNPSQLCKPGTPLPILYDIEHYGDRCEIVRSMPFPFPMFEISHPTEIYCATINFFTE